MRWRCAEAGRGFTLDGVLAQEAVTSAAFPTAGAVGLIAAVVFVLGYRLAVLHRAHSDYRKTKAAVKPLRKERTAAFWGTVKFGFWVFVAGCLLIAWVAHDVRRMAGR